MYVSCQCEDSELQSLESAGLKMHPHLKAQVCFFSSFLFYYSIHDYFRFACRSTTTIALNFHNDNMGLKNEHV